MLQRAVSGSTNRSALGQKRSGRSLPRDGADAAEDLRNRRKSASLSQIAMPRPLPATRLVARTLLPRIQAPRLLMAMMPMKKCRDWMTLTRIAISQSCLPCHGRLGQAVWDLPREQQTGPSCLNDKFSRVPPRAPAILPRNLILTSRRSLFGGSCFRLLRKVSARLPLPTDTLRHSRPGL
jgi:hypothetical protein